MNIQPTPPLNCTNIKNLYCSSEKNTQQANQLAILLKPHFSDFDHFLGHFLP